MRLTTYTDYSLRMLMYLAVKDGAAKDGAAKDGVAKDGAANGEDGRATIGEIADAYGIAKNHLTKVAHQLGVAGYVETVRGKGGGLRLARPAERIGLGEVVRHAEGDMALVPCFEPLCAPCPIVPACGLRGALHEARQAFLAVLDRITLADLVARRTELHGLLAIGARESAAS